MRWFHALTPREERLFGYFIDQAWLLPKAPEAAAADALSDGLRW